MRRRALLAASLPLLALPALAHPPRQPDAAESQKFIQEVTALRAHFAKAVRDRNAAALRAAYADAYTHTHESGKLDDKETRIASALAGAPLVEAAPATDLAYRVFTGPTVIVTGKSTMPDAKAQTRFDVRWVCVYITARDGWELAVSQATRLPAPTN
ncbi:MAG: DUF4440 domain-containing protein [Proteobacteria bacterium]|nr:DUF4440 domain-containing protein [Pseudomonadota bacterium]